MKRATLFGFPIHQMLIPFPIGLLATSFFFDIAWLLFGAPDLAKLAWRMILAGVIAALVAAAPGLLDFRSIPRATENRRLGAVHGLGTVLMVLLFAASWVLRRDDPARPESLAIALSGVAVAVAVLTAWLGARVADGLGRDEGVRDSDPLWL